MAKKRSPHPRKPVQKAPPLSRRRQLFLVAALVPVTVGLFLFIASWFEFTLFGTAESQTLAGALLALGGFALANAIQGLWRLAAGWLLIGVAIWLAVTATQPELRWVAGAIGAVGLALLLASFVSRYREVRKQSG